MICLYLFVRPYNVASHSNRLDKASLIDASTYCKKKSKKKCHKFKSNFFFRVAKNYSNIQQYVIFILFTLHIFSESLSNWVCALLFPLGFKSKMWDIIVLVSDHCLSFYISDAAQTPRL